MKLFKIQRIISNIFSIFLKKYLKKIHVKLWFHSLIFIFKTIKLLSCIVFDNFSIPVIKRNKFSYSFLPIYPSVVNPIRIPICIANSIPNSCKFPIIRHLSSSSFVMNRMMSAVKEKFARDQRDIIMDWNCPDSCDQRKS